MIARTTKPPDQTPRRCPRCWFFGFTAPDDSMLAAQLMTDARWTAPPAGGMLPPGMSIAPLAANELLNLANVLGTSDSVGGLGMTVVVVARNATEVPGSVE
jgi:hypothetical protein